MVLGVDRDPGRRLVRHRRTVDGSVGDRFKDRLELAFYMDGKFVDALFRKPTVRDTRRFA